MRATQNCVTKSRRWVWAGVMIASLAMLIAGVLKLASVQHDESEKPAGSKSEPAVTVPFSEGQDVHSKAASQTTDNLAEARSTRSSRAKRLQAGQTPNSGACPTPALEYPKISPEIFEWAKTKSAEELIRLINDNYSPATDGEAGTVPWENETSLKASWALALRLRDDPSLYPVFRAAIMSGQLTRNAASRLAEILGFMDDDRATDLLLELVRLAEPPARLEELIRAIGGMTGRRERQTPLETYVERLDHVEPAQRGGFPWLDPPDKRLPNQQIVETFLFLFDNRMGSWEARNRGELLMAMGDILSVCRKLSESGGQEEPRSASFREQILQRIEWLAKNSEDPGDRSEALRTLALYPQGDRTLASFLNALSDTNERVRLSALEGLGHFDTCSEAVTALTELARNDPHLEVRTTAIGYLPAGGSAGQEKLTLSLALYSSNQSYSTKQTALWLLAGCGLEAIPHLERIAREEPDANLREQARTAIENVKSLADFDRRVEEVQDKREELNKHREE